MHEEHGSWLKPLADALPPSLQGWVDVFVLNTWVVIIALVVLAWLGTRRRARIPSGLQNAWEMYVEFLRGFCREQIGLGAEKYAPLLGTILLYILCMNLLGLVPGFLTPTMSLNVTAALALSVFFFVQYSGFATLGLGYLMHFVGEPWWLFIINIPVHIIGELAKPLSLAVRLFGNMFGEETAITRMAALGALIMPFTIIPIPVQIINVALHLIIGPIQAFIFFILSAAYIEMATATHNHEQHDAHDQPEPTPESHDRVEQAA